MRVVSWYRRGQKYPYWWSLLNAEGKCVAGGNCEDTAVRERDINRAKMAYGATTIDRELYPIGHPKNPL